MEAILIGKELLEFASIATIVTESVKSIYNLIDTIKTKSHTKNSSAYTDMSYHFEKLDIRTKLDTYGSLLCEFPGTNSQAVRNSLISVKNVISEIESKIKGIKNKIDYNKSLWIFVNLRSYSFAQDFKDLEQLVDKLDKRIHSLKNVIEISKLWNSGLFRKSEGPENINKLDKETIDIDYFVARQS
jgi:hypothetical protein